MGQRRPGALNARGNIHVVGIGNRDMGKQRPGASNARVTIGATEVKGNIGHGMALP